MSTLTCKYHPDIQAVNTCDKCHASICLNDIRRDLGGILCPECLKLGKRKNKKNLIIFIILLPILIVFGFLIGAFLQSMA